MVILPKYDLGSYPINEEAFEVRDLLRRILDATISVYDSYGVPLPDRRLWGLGAIPEDCDQLSVVLKQIALGVPGQPQGAPMPCNGPRFAVVEVTVTRKFPQGPNAKPLPPEDMQNYAGWTATDAWVLMNALREYDKTPLGTRGSGVLATLNANPPQGLLQSTVLTLTIGIL